VPAPKNPYRRSDELVADGWGDLTATREGIMRHPIEGLTDDISTQPIGLAALDLDTIARRNYSLGRKHARRDADGEIRQLRDDLRQAPVKPYDEGYDAGWSDAEEQAFARLLDLLGPARVIAEEYADGRVARKRLTPKQREERAAELAGYVRAVYNLLTAFEPLVADGEQATVRGPRTVEGLAALREFMAKHGPDYTFTVS
jgi:hypothetical protein